MTLKVGSRIFPLGSTNISFFLIVVCFALLFAFLGGDQKRKITLLVGQNEENFMDEMAFDIVFRI